MKIGVLDLQGAVSEHVRMLEACGAEPVRVKTPGELEGLQGVIIPGGESTTIGKLMAEYGFMEALRKKGKAGLPIFGTCAGLILLSKDIIGSHQPRLGLMDTRVERNAFGRQRESFEADLEVAGLGTQPFRGVFIRAPYVEEIGDGAEPLASFDGKIVMVRQGVFLACAFHPELTDDLRIHKLFLEICKKGLARGDLVLYNERQAPHHSERDEGEQ